MITEQQKTFILLFIFDAERNADHACTELGIRPSVARSWFKDTNFQKAMRDAEAFKLRIMGYSAAFVMEDTLAIAHSDIGKVQLAEGQSLEDLPRRVRIGIKSVKFKSAIDAQGKVVTYISEVTMRDNAWALAKAAEWFEVEKIVKNGGVMSEDDKKPIAGLIVRPPISREEAEAEELLK